MPRSTLVNHLMPESELHRSMKIDSDPREVANNEFYTKISYGKEDTSADVVQIDTRSRLCVVRYFLDRPGYGLHNCAARLWFNPPPTCTPCNVRDFLSVQGIALEGLLVELYLDKFEAFMLLDACEDSMVEWNFENTTIDEPGFLNVRLTDLVHAHQAEECKVEKDNPFPHTQTMQRQQQNDSNLANITPVGLFSFSIMVGLETVALLSHLIPGSIDESFLLIWGPSMVFLGGLMQVIVGIFQTLRNNIYGATAFLSFGCIWFTNGLKVILDAYFAADGTRADELLESRDPWGSFVRHIFIFAFSAALLKQTFVMNRLSTTLISLLCLKVGAGAFAGLSRAMQWIQLVFGCLTSLFAFYVFMVELTNQVYHREVFPVHKWSDKHSPEEVFGAAGRAGTLQSKAARLRQAYYPIDRRIREASSPKATATSDG